MNKLSLIQAVNQALHYEMTQRPEMILLGEDIGKDGGVFRATDGLVEQFGEERVVDTPLSESGIIGAAIGMAAYGLRPVAEIQFMGFLYGAMEQLVSHAARLRARTLGRYTCPLVVRTPYGGGIHAPELHSESTEAFFIHTPGLKVVVPSTPAEAKGLLLSAIRDPDPVIFLEPAKIYRAIKEEVPEGEYLIPLGKARVVAEGCDVSLITWGAMLHPTLEAAAQMTKKGIQAEVIDLRTLSPLDTESLIQSVKKTGRAVIVHEAARTCGLGGEIAALLCERALLSLEAPILRVTGFDTPVPLPKNEKYYFPDCKEIIEAIETVVQF
ncbi:Branched-chain alpha-keto acid dehydrogenase, E1 component, beta subunit [hydrothermal vent metagenome]|uniref:Branched-chain alpha-keto acid dehydrogenase, E1 component, beta subunit n=1 Tax=hydrothermal vent metagenome TaxID=652676 RepID=A0A3B1CK49_9ZZZZ